MNLRRNVKWVLGIYLGMLYYFALREFSPNLIDIVIIFESIYGCMNMSLSGLFVHEPLHDSLMPIKFSEVSEDRCPLLCT